MRGLILNMIINFVMFHAKAARDEGYPNSEFQRLSLLGAEDTLYRTYMLHMHQCNEQQLLQQRSSRQSMQK